VAKQLFFYFDPICPWAWRASLWIREVAKVRPIKISWDFLSLAAANAGKDSLQQVHSQSETAFRTMALARRLGGNEAVDKLYLALGYARHDRKEELNDPRTIEAALTEAGLDTSLLSQALEDLSTLEIVQNSHSYIMERKGFGVPTLVLKDGDRESPAMFGPVISKVPEGEEAGQLWDRVEWLMWQPDFFELKRNR
jgi:2-hydroxychromene-2-carboxylate isomerase